MILSLLFSAQLTLSDIKVSPKVLVIPTTTEAVSDSSYGKKVKGGKGKSKGKGKKGSKGSKGKGKKR